MKAAIIGSRSIHTLDLKQYLPDGISEIISGGAEGVDRIAKAYAQEHSIPCTEFLPDYARYRRGAPLRRNRQIAEACDMLIAFWDGKSKGTAYTVRLCREMGKPVTLHLIQ